MSGVRQGQASIQAKGSSWVRVRVSGVGFGRASGHGFGFLGRLGARFSHVRGLCLSIRFVSRNLSVFGCGRCSQDSCAKHSTR